MPRWGGLLLPRTLVLAVHLGLQCLADGAPAESPAQVLGIHSPLNETRGVAAQQDFDSTVSSVWHTTTLGLMVTDSLLPGANVARKYFPELDPGFVGNGDGTLQELNVVDLFDWRLECPASKHLLGTLCVYDTYPEGGVVGSAVTYTHNDELRSLSNLMIAYNAAVYTFKNGFYRAGVFVPETYDVDNFGSIGVATPGFAVGKFTDSTSDPNDFCTSADPAYPITYDNPANKNLCTHPDSNYHACASVYTHERANDVLVTLAFRGSQTPDVLALNLLSAEGVSDILRNWMGVDLNADPTTVDAAICKSGHDAGVQIHTGFQSAWLAMRTQAVGLLYQQINAAKAAANGTKPVKALVTGYSLGAAVATVATYDLWCNKGSPTSIDGELFGTINLGQVGVFTDAGHYESIVPVSKRIRILTASMEHSLLSAGLLRYWQGDFVGAWTPLWGYAQPAGDLQAAWVRYDNYIEGIGGATIFTGYSNCYGLESALCHLLNRYAQGMRRDNGKYNGGLCKAVSDPDDTKCITPDKNGGGQNGFPA